jgi:hypothetical protein
MRVTELINSVLYGQMPTAPKKSKSNMLVERFERLQRLRNLAIEDKQYCKVFQANRLLKDLTERLNHLSNFTLN